MEAVAAAAEEDDEEEELSTGDVLIEEVEGGEDEDEEDVDTGALEEDEGVERDGSLVVDVPDDAADDCSIVGEAEVGAGEDSGEACLGVEVAEVAGGAWDEVVGSARELAGVVSGLVALVDVSRPRQARG
ncbi:hypothetical protein G6O67_002974 [Ophiocordyceps sinensis]|uniref:Uncharacterized protein n=1 Tax=Ophiocordyceps sinensis TaxID=72228 RepID=A0A8H4PVC3_9HYPO|nr:hypothetical protein G6O67_002974 [Ophiocordyceps sinensis]